MCIDVLAPGYCIDIEFLSEQIWIRIRENVRDRVEITEVYDLCISNPRGNRALDRLWLLFPHDYTIAHGSRRKHTIEIWPMNAPLWERQKRYNWLYACAPTYSELDNSIAWYIFNEGPHLRAQGYPSLKGRILHCDRESIAFPPELQQGDIDLLADPDIKKTVVSAKFERPLGAGDSGWLRIIARPQSLDLPGEDRGSEDRGSSLKYSLFVSRTGHVYASVDMAPGPLN